VNESASPLLVELYLEGAHIAGICRQVQERLRLIDLLNHQDDMIRVENAIVTLSSGAKKHFEAIDLLKDSIIAAVPRETHRQSRRRAVLTNTMARHTTQQLSLAVFVPPLQVEGTAHITEGAGATHSFRIFSKFFSLTSATLTVAGAAPRELGVVLVNRDQVVAMGELRQQRLARAG